MIPVHLQLKDIASRSEDLPELTQDEIKNAILLEKQRRATLVAMSVDDVVLSSDAIERLLLKAREDKLSKISLAKYWAKVDTETPPLTLTPKQMYETFLARASFLINKNFLIDEHNHAIIKKLCYYFSNSSESELDRGKGLLLMGGVGTGKTTIMRSFANNPLCSFKINSARRISYDFAENGFAIVKSLASIDTSPRNAFGQTELGLCIDDLGTDEERKHYGDKVNALTEIILNRYDSLPHRYTHITTNLNAEAIEKIYGSRIRSRMREMFNLVSFDTKAPDRRR